MFKEVLDGLGYWVIRFGAFAVQRLPAELGLALGRGLGGFVGLFHKRRGTAYVNLKAAFPESTARQRKQWVREMFQNLGMTGVEIMRFPVLKKEDVDRYVATNAAHRDHYLKFRRNKKSAILLTAHFGNWEFSQIAEAIWGRPLAVLARRQRHKRLDDLLNSFRKCQGSISLERDAGIRDLLRVLRQGEAVGVLGDQAGGEEGVWVRFFGRLTTSPRGPVAIALKHEVNILPVFFVRREGPYHELCFEPPLPLIKTGDPEKDIQINMQNYIRILESYIVRYPSQWLWTHKRWKWTRTRRITVLSDGKSGHVKQSEALAWQIMEIGGSKNPPYEFLLDKIEVEFRSPWHKRLFSLCALFFIPWAQGRLAWLRFFFAPGCLRKLEETNPDLVISTGASLAPLNLCLQRENLAKSAVLMKPGFPYNLFRYDLAFIPHHDRGVLPRGSYRIHGAFSKAGSELFESSGRQLGESIRDPGKVKLGVFLGGETRNFKPTLLEIENLLREVEQASEKLGGDFLLTTSRRTPEPINQFLENQLQGHPRCQLCVIPAKDPRPEVVPGMMALADFLVVTEDSLSMISEALSSGKNVVVLKWAKDGLPPKHYRFQERLAKEWDVPVIEAGKLCETLLNGNGRTFGERLDKEQRKIREKLEALL